MSPSPSNTPAKSDAAPEASPSGPVRSATALPARLRPWAPPMRVQLLGALGVLTGLVEVGTERLEVTFGVVDSALEDDLRSAG